eukprot:4986927-Prymnesium_polylepis.1
MASAVSFFLPFLAASMRRCRARSAALGVGVAVLEASSKHAAVLRASPSSCSIVAAGATGSLVRSANQGRSTAGRPSPGWKSTDCAVLCLYRLRCAVLVPTVLACAPSRESKRGLSTMASSGSCGSCDVSGVIGALRAREGGGVLLPSPFPPLWRRWWPCL